MQTGVSLDQALKFNKKQGTFSDATASPSGSICDAPVVSVIPGSSAVVFGRSLSG